MFCQRLKTIWDEQGIFCQTYPTITNQILDFYKLYHLVQDKQGYLEISTNRGWKEVSNVLGFGDSGREKCGYRCRRNDVDVGSAAYSVKRNYVRLGLLAYECRFDRAGIDPRSVLELSEMPHTVRTSRESYHFLVNDDIVDQEEKTWEYDHANCHQSRRENSIISFFLLLISISLPNNKNMKKSNPHHPHPSTINFVQSLNNSPSMICISFLFFFVLVISGIVIDISMHFSIALVIHEQLPR